MRRERGVSTARERPAMRRGRGVTAAWAGRGTVVMGTAAWERCERGIIAVREWRKHGVGGVIAAWEGRHSGVELAFCSCRRTWFCPCRGNFWLVVSLSTVSRNIVSL